MVGTLPSISFSLPIWLSFRVAGFLLQHIPNLESFQDLLTVFTLANAMELLNVVDYQTYRVETNLTGEDSELPADPGLPAFLRLQYNDARTKSRQLLHYFFSNFEVVDSSGLAVDGPNDLYYHFLAQQLSALINMKLQGFDEKVGGAPDCTFTKFEREFKMATSNSPLLSAAAKKYIPAFEMVDNFLWGGDEYSIRRLSSQIQCDACKCLRLLDCGRLTIA